MDDLGVLPILGNNHMGISWNFQMAFMRNPKIEDGVFYDGKWEIDLQRMGISNDFRGTRSEILQKSINRVLP